MRGIALVLVLALALVACGDDPVAERPPASETAVPTTDPATSAEPLDECGDVSIEAGTDDISWMAATDDPWGFIALPAEVDGGFAIGTDSCVTIVDTDGSLRWSRTTGHFLNATQTGDHIIVATTPTEPDGAILTAYDAATGAIIWDDSTTTGTWHSVTSLDSVAILTGTGNGRMIATFDAATGRPLATRTADAGIAPATPLPHGDLMLIGGTDEAQGRLFVVDNSGTIQLDVPVVPRYPVPVAAHETTVVLQASGIDDNSDDVEPTTFLAAYDLATGAEQWRITVDGERAHPAVQVGDTIVVGTTSGLTAIEIPTGAVRWSDDTPTNESTRFAAVGNDGFAVGAIDGVVRVMEIGDGSPRWQLAIDNVARLIGTTTGERLLVIDDTGRHLMVDGDDGSEIWTTAGPIPARRDVPPGHSATAHADDIVAIIACPVAMHPCPHPGGRTDQRIVAISLTGR